MSIGDQIRYVGELVNRKDVGGAVAVSLLQCSYPIQVPVSDRFLYEMADSAIPPLDFSYPSGVLNPLTGKFEKKDPLELRDAGVALAAFPIKKTHPGATNKVNVFLSELGDSFNNNDNMLYQTACGIAPYLSGRLYNDQASAWLLYAKALEKVLGGLKALTLSARVLLHPKPAKILGQCIKALGANINHLGSMLVEGESLQGRGVGEGDLLDEARCRVDPRRVAEGLAVFDPIKLRETIDKIVSEELRGPVAFESLEEHWEGRWGWCVNGSHARLLERCRPQYKVRDIPGLDRFYRRMFAEGTFEEPVSGWDGHVFVTASPKLEHGKTRSIFACDSVSYFAFEHLLKPCENLWQGRRVILDPGAKGNAGMVEKVRLLRGRGGVSIMLDFDDFNSQHTLSAQQAVIASLAEATNYPKELANRLIASFEHMEIHVKGASAGTATGTLMSGHRGTTFINSVLNAAYIRLSVGEEEYSRCWAMHVGDDVYLSAPTFDAASQVLNGMARSPCRLNPNKQSVGSVSAEFLRTCSDDRVARGYVTRAISSCISGNWVSDLKLDALGGLNSMVQNCRTLYNRSGGVEFAYVLSPSCARMCGTSTAIIRPILEGAIAVGAGPQFRSSGYYRTFEVDEGKEEVCDFNTLSSVPAGATSDYLGSRTSELEQVAIWEMGYNVRRAMIRSSYNKALLGGKQDTPKLRGHMAKLMVPVGSVEISEALTRAPRVGVLSSHPLLQLLKSALSNGDLRTLVGLGGGDRQAADIHEEAWGGEAHGIVVRGFVSYTDASAAARRADVGVVYTVRPYYI